MTELRSALETLIEEWKELALISQYGIASSAIRECMADVRFILRTIPDPYVPPEMR